MCDRSFRIALKYLESAMSLEQKREAILELLKDVKNKKIKDKKDFIIILKESNITDRDLIQIIQKDIDRGKNILDFIMYLGEGNLGLGIIPSSWFYRNISDKDVLKGIPPKYWDLVRNTEWVKQHNV